MLEFIDKPATAIVKKEFESGSCTIEITMEYFPKLDKLAEGQGVKLTAKFIKSEGHEIVSAQPFLRQRDSRGLNTALLQAVKFAADSRVIGAPSDGKTAYIGVRRPIVGGAEEIGLSLGLLPKEKRIA